MGDFAGHEKIQATHFNLLWEILRVLCWYFEHERRVQFEGCVAVKIHTITAILP